MEFIACIIGVVLLARASDIFVDGAASIADRMKISRIVIGTVIVGFGTSAPEMLASALASAQGEPEVAIGNVVGSNIANVTLILGAAAMIGGVMHIDSGVLRREMPFSVVAVALFALFVTIGLEWWGGIILLALLVVALWLSLRDGKMVASDELAIDVGELVELEAARSLGVETARTIAGLIGTVAGAQALVWGSLEIADRFGLSGGFVGFTLVALGTSLPELVTAVQAARKGEDELIIGNLLGSNLFNATAVGGIMAFLGGTALQETTIATSELVLMVVLCAASAALLFRRLTRLEGAILFAMYAAALALIA